LQSRAHILHSLVATFVQRMDYTASSAASLDQPVSVDALMRGAAQLRSH
jgi:hypothetical protein